MTRESLLFGNAVLFLTVVIQAPSVASVLHWRRWRPTVVMVRAVEVSVVAGVLEGARALIAVVATQVHFRLVTPSLERWSSSHFCGASVADGTLVAALRGPLLRAHTCFPHSDSSLAHRISMLLFDCI